MGERAIGFRHLVGVFALLYGCAAACCGVHQLARATARSMVFSLRARAGAISQRIASASRRTGRTSTGT